MKIVDGDILQVNVGFCRKLVVIKYKINHYFILHACGHYALYLILTFNKPSQLIFLLYVFFLKTTLVCACLLRRPEVNLVTNYDNLSLVEENMLWS